MGANTSDSKENLPIDQVILWVTILFMGIGLVQVYSSSFIFATEMRDDGLFFFRKQFIFTILSLGGLSLAAFFPLFWVKKLSIFIWPVAIILVIATLLPGIGVQAGGAHRWLRLPLGLRFESGEFLKLALSIVMARAITFRWEVPAKWEYSIKFLIVVAPLAILLKQPDFGTLVICLLVATTMLFGFGLKWRWIFAGLVVAIPTLVSIVWLSPYRRARVLAFLDPWADPDQKGFQIIQSLLSFHSGGITGVGIGQGQGKLFFLPEAHTDFTLAILGEEYGFVGFAIILVLFGTLIFRGLQIVGRTEDPFFKAMALGLISTIAYSVFINIGVVLGMLPTKGLALPFLSYGGSSLLMTCFMIGLLINISRNQVVLVSSSKKKSKVPIKYHPSANRKKKRW